MQITEMRVSFVQFESIAEPLRSFAPSIPFGFLLDSGKYAEQFAQSVQKPGPCRAPWSGGYGGRFWRSYIEKDSPPAREYWDHLVPFQYDLEPPLTGDWLKGHAKARAYLYPWGVGGLIDLSVTETKDIDDAVDLVVAIRNTNPLEMTLNGNVQKGPAPFLLSSFLSYVRGIAFGPKAPEGTRSELFMIVTVLDASSVDSHVAVVNGSPLHVNLNGFARGIRNWKNAVPDPLDKTSLGTGQGSAGCVLLGTRRGRTVWYPDSFRSLGSGFKNTLRCYHQNLTVVTLQTEALCMFAADAAALIGAGKKPGNWLPNYDQCGRRAAGLLGRLAGAKRTYRSHSPENQIQTGYSDEVKALRDEYFKP